MKLTWAVVTIIWGTLSTSTEGLTLATSGPKTAIKTKCTGDSLVLNEPRFDNRAHHVFVYRNDETVATTSVPVAGRMKGRLLVNSDTSVLLTNLTSADLGLYHVEVKLSNETTEEFSVSLVIGEPPETIDGKLSVFSDSSETSFVSLKCGAFTSLGYPPVSVVWRDPSGLLLASTGFSEQFFTLKLPVNISKSGNYCCQLDCGGPNYCCLDGRSPLRQCAQVDVQTGGKDKQEGRDATPCNLTSLEQRVSEMDVILRELNVTSLLQRVSEVDVLVRELRSEKVGEDCGHSSAAAMAHLVHRQAKCDQLDSFIDRVDAAEMKFEKDFEGVDRIVKYMQDQLDSMNQTMTDLQNGVGKDYSSDNHQLTTNTSDQFEDYISRMDGIDKKFSSLDKTLNDHRLQCNEETMKIKTTLQNEVSRLKLIDDRILKLDDRMSNVDDWMSKSSDYQSQMTRNLMTIGQDVVAIKMAADHGVSTTKSKVASLEKDLYAYLNRCNSSCLAFNALKGCPREKGYRLFRKRCLKLYTLKKNFTEAKLHCEADGAHLVHLKSRDIDLPAFISLMSANGRQKSGHYFYGLWIGATDIVTEGNFQWSDGTELPTDSDLWDNGEPNDKHDNEDCVQVLYQEVTVLNDVNCSSEYDFVCQTDLHFAT